MPHASLLHPGQSFHNPSFPINSSQQVQLEHPTNALESTALPHSFNYAQQARAMAQTSFQQYRTATSYVRGQPAQSADDQRQYANAQPWGNSNDAMFAQNSFLPSGTIFDQDFEFNGSLDMSPHAMSKSAGSLHLNNRLAYPGSGSYGFPSTGSTKYCDDNAWCPMRSTEAAPRGLSMNGSNSESNSSYSPKSFVSETHGSEAMPFTPESASEITNWSSYGSQTRPAIKASSPDSLAVAIEENAGNFSAPSRYAMGDIVHSPTPAGITQCMNGLPVVGDDTSSLYDSEYAYSQESSPGLSPWYTEGNSGMAMPFRPRNPPVTSVPSSFSTAYQNPNASSASRGPPSWGGPQTNFPIQDRAQSHRVVDSHTQRKADDQILLEGKKNGLTYKEIRKRMYTKCAESTLRGRYRSLTKARQDRVRKPVWRKKDLDLLKMFVQQDLDRINSNYLPQALSYEQRLAKVQWKKVADSIHTSGGSYHFGNSTCKRKWQELNPGS